MRHGKSDWKSGANDDLSRPLSKRGRRSVPRVAEWMLTHDLIPDRILSSPAERTRQTVDLVTATLGIGSEKVIFDDRLYLAGMQDLLRVITEHAEAGSTLMLVGHNPGLENLLLYLANVPVRTTPGIKRMPTAALAWLENGSHAPAPERGSMTLADLVIPRSLDD